MVDNRKTRVEVLAPAGSFDIMKAVVAAGADAVYLGGNMFGARAFANNFNTEELIEAIEYAHLFGRKIYLTVNTLIKQNEIENSLVNYLVPYYEAGLDAVIVQDLGVLKLIKEHFPDMDIHASTQMTQTGLYGSRLLKELGASRIVTSREMTLPEIKQLNDGLDVEIESFVHGALCYCYSGQCLLSSFNGGRSGNRGRCAQPCRMPYDVYDGGRVINDKKHKYALSPKDMCALDILPDVIESGVYSLKIEGRMKNVTYASMVTSIYRKYVDMYLERGRDGYKVDANDINDLMDIYNRGAFTSGYYNEEKGRKMMSCSRPNHMGTECLRVMSNNSGRITFAVLRDINRGDVFEIDKEHSFESGMDVSKGGVLSVNLPKKYPLYPGRIICRMNNSRIKGYVEEHFVGSKPELKVDMCLLVKKGQPLTIKVYYENEVICIEGEKVEEARNIPADKDNIVKNLKKTGETCFIADNVNVELDPDVFVPVGWIKDLRRRALEQLEGILRKSGQRRYSGVITGILPDERIESVGEKENGKVSESPEYIGNRKTVYLHNLNYIDVVAERSDVDSVYLDYKIMYFNEMDYITGKVHNCTLSGKNVYAVLPHVLKSEDYDKFRNLILQFLSCEITGYVCRNIEQIGFLSELFKEGEAVCCAAGDGVHIVTDSGLYVFNTYAVEELETLCDNAGVIVDRMTLPLELTKKEMLCVNNAPMELIVYGKVPLMISNQCVRKTYNICDGKWGRVELENSKGDIYSVKSMCGFCYSLMEGKTLNLMGENLKDFKGCTFRYEFDEESADDIQSVLDGRIEGGYTGHFHKAVD